MAFHVFLIEYKYKRNIVFRIISIFGMTYTTNWI